jgi:hypothetical protein
MTTYIPTDFANHPALDPTEYLSEQEIEEILEREQREANAKFGSGSKAFDEHLHPRDAEGQFTETPGSGTAVLEKDPMAHVHFTIGTLDKTEQQTVHETLDRLGEKYPAGASMITAVTAKPMKGRWGQMSDQGEMRLTNLGKKYEDMHDPELAGTVTHEFGHALFRNMAGFPKPNVPPEGRPPTARRQFDSGVPVSVIRERISQWNEVMAEYNAMVDDQARTIASMVTDIHRKIADAFDHDPDRIHIQLVAEFGGGPGYVATGDGGSISYTEYLSNSPEEVLAQAFSHYENGQHGVIADIVGHTVEEHYGVTS